MRYFGKLQDKNNTFYCPITYGYSGAYPDYKWYYVPGVGYALYRSGMFVNLFRTEGQMFIYLGKGYDARQGPGSDGPADYGRKYHICIGYRLLVVHVDYAGRMCYVRHW